MSFVFISHHPETQFVCFHTLVILQTHCIARRIDYFEHNTMSYFTVKSKTCSQDLYNEPLFILGKTIICTVWIHTCVLESFIFIEWNKSDMQYAYDVSIISWKWNIVSLCIWSQHYLLKMEILASLCIWWLYFISRDKTRIVCVIKQNIKN